MLDENQDMKMLQETLDKLISNVKSKIGDEDVASVILSTIPDGAYNQQDLNPDTVQNLIDVETLVSGDPITVMSYMNNYDMEIDTIQGFQASALLLLAYYTVS